MSESENLERRKARNRQQILDIASYLYRQIRYGCGNEACKTPTCFTFEQRQAGYAPYRRPTILSARAMAAYMASLPSPTMRMCKHGQSVMGNVYDQAFSEVPPKYLPGLDDASRERYGMNDPKEIDNKSLIQLLFNSTAWRNARFSAPPETAQGVVQATILLGMELKLVRPTHDPTSLYNGLDALCDFLPRFNQPSVSQEVQEAVWSAWVDARQRGRYLVEPRDGDQASQFTAQGCVELSDRFQDENALRLLRHILRAFAACIYTADKPTACIKAEFDLLGFLVPKSAPLLPSLQSKVKEPTWHSDQPFRLAPTAHVVLEWCRAMLQTEWNDKAVISRSSFAGCAIEFMGLLYRHRELLEIDKKLFQTPYIFKRLDFMDVPRSWLEDEVPENHAHILSYPWLFPVSSLVTYFRVINHFNMSRAFNASVSLQYLINRHKILVDSNDEHIFERLRIAMGQLLVLEIKRHKILEDAMNELWRRQKRELRRPLKVRMGMDEGEEGVDFGGVQQEFFRLSLSEALDPDYGLFTTDETTRMAWFLPCSKAPLHHFVLVGLLVGLAVYNGITLSVTFPSALYRKLLDEPVETLEHIEDGWPTLTKGLRHLLDYEDGDVSDVFMRTYAFSVATNGTTVSADMQAHPRNKPWPGPDGPEPSEAVEAGAAVVTNENRARYVDDYIFWLTDASVRAQYEAFAKGFFLCVEKRSLRLFDAASFRNLVEGYQRVDVDALERTAAYDNGYHPQHEVIQHFWHIVRNFSDVEVRKLLEFVTASDRVPAKGIEEIVFIVQRNGKDDERLPTSQTCFGRLLLPEYSSRDVLETKLRLAMVHSLGFYLQ